MNRNPELVFVYGTLKRGFVNHHWLAGCGFEGEGTVAGLVLHDLGPFPMAIPGSGAVRGEVFRLAAEALGRLDRLEGYPRLYDRMPMPLLDGRWAWVYVGRPRQVRFVPAMAEGLWMGTAPGAAVHRNRMSLAVAALLAGAALLAAALPAPSLALDTLTSCNAWRASHGTARILLGNRIGAAHYLTKRHRLQDSPADAPVALYSDSDLQRACGGR